jgi:hypothetical protein
LLHRLRLRIHSTAQPDRHFRRGPAGLVSRRHHLFAQPGKAFGGDHIQQHAVRPAAGYPHCRGPESGYGERAGHRIKFVPFMLLAFPLMLLSIAIASGYVWLRYL